MAIEQRLNELGITLPPAGVPLANYASYVQEGNLLFIAGQLPLGDDGQLAYVGKLGKEISVEEGYAAARLCALYCIAQVKAAVSSLDKVKRVLRVGGFVNCTDDFIQMPQVLNGASDLIVEVFGDKGPHTRAVVGSNSLHGGVAVEVEMMVAVAVA